MQSTKRLIAFPLQDACKSSSNRPETYGCTLQRHGAKLDEAPVSDDEMAVICALRHLSPLAQERLRATIADLYAQDIRELLSDFSRLSLEPSAAEQAASRVPSTAKCSRLADSATRRSSLITARKNDEVPRSAKERRCFQRTRRRCAAHHLLQCEDA